MPTDVAITLVTVAELRIGIWYYQAQQQTIVITQGTVELITKRIPETGDKSKNM